MERFYKQVEDLEKEKAQELYKEICAEIIEKNGLKNTAIEMLTNFCDARIREQIELDRNRDYLTKVAPIWKGIKRAVTIIGNGV